MAWLSQKLDMTNKQLNQDEDQDYTIIDAYQDIIRVLFESLFRVKWLRIARRLIKDSEARKLTGGRVGRDAPLAKIWRGA